MHLRILVLVSTTLVGVALSSGCATIVKGTTQTIPIASEPSGARVSVDGAPAGTTPTKVTLDRKRSHMVTLELEDHETENIPVTNSIGGAVAGNIIAGGLIGWGVDAATGAQYNLHPETINARLRPKSGPSTAASKANSLSDELTKLDELKTTGRISDDEHTKLRAAAIASYQTTPTATPAVAK